MPLWRRRDQDDCAWAQFGEDCVVYHRSSGITHLLNGVSVRLLFEVLLSPVTLDDIVSIFMSDGNADEDEYRAEFLAVLARLEYFGLVELVSPRGND